MADDSTDTQQAIDDQLVLGRALRVLRQRNGMTQRELAERASMMSYYISLIENGRRGLRWHTIMRLLRALNATAAQLGREVDRQQHASADQGVKER